MEFISANILEISLAFLGLLITWAIWVSRNIFSNEAADELDSQVADQKSKNLEDRDDAAMDMLDLAHRSIADVRDDIKEMRQEVRDARREVNEFRHQVNDKISALRKENTQQHAEVEREFNKLKESVYTDIQDLKESQKKDSEKLYEFILNTLKI